MNTGNKNFFISPQNDFFEFLTTPLKLDALLAQTKITKFSFFFTKKHNKKSATVNHKTHIDLQAIGYVFKTTTNFQLSALDTICETERTKVLGIPTMSVKSIKTSLFYQLATEVKQPKILLL